MAGPDDRPRGLTEADRDDLDRIADEMAADGMPRSAEWLRRIVHPDRMREWELSGVRPCFAWGMAVGVVLVLAVQVWADVVRGWLG